MMGYQPQSQEKLFYTRFNLSQRIPKNHILRKITNMVDFDFIYKEVKYKYGYNGNISVPPPVILKLILLLLVKLSILMPIVKRGIFVWATAP